MNSVHRPSNIIANPNSKSQAVTCPRSTTTTFIRCVNALGFAPSPFFMFKGQRWNIACNRAARTMSVSCCQTVMSSKTTYRINFCQIPDKLPTKHIHNDQNSLKTPETMKRAKEQCILLFVPAANSPPLLQPIDVAICGQSKQSSASAECVQFIIHHMERTFTKYDVCSRPQPGFHKIRIYPQKADVTSHDQLLPCEIKRVKNVELKQRKFDVVSSEIKKVLKEEDFDGIRKSSE